MSLETARFWADIAKIALMAGVLVGVLSAFVVAFTAEVINDRSEAALQEADKARQELVRDVAKLEAEAQKAKEGVARLVNESIKLRKEVAEANHRTAEAQLALERLKAPRVLGMDQRSVIVEELKSFAGTPFVTAAAHDPEAQALMSQIEDVLTEAGFEQKPWRGRELLASRPGKPATGVTAVIGLYVQADSSRSTQLEPAVTAIATALRDRGLEAKAEVGRMTANTNQGAIQILVGKKP
jgi:F0F1-type ATP synthase membrane subunit b/b'